MVRVNLSRVLSTTPQTPGAGICVKPSHSLTSEPTFLSAVGKQHVKNTEAIIEHGLFNRLKIFQEGWLEAYMWEALEDEVGLS